MRHLLWTLLAPTLLPLACATAPTPTPAAPTETSTTTTTAAIPVDDLATVKAKLAAGAVLVDVRPAAYARAHPAMVDAAIPFADASARLAEFEALVGGDKTKPVVVACGNGSKALEVKALLLQHGFTDVSAQAIGNVAASSPPAP